MKRLVIILILICVLFWGIMLLYRPFFLKKRGQSSQITSLDAYVNEVERKIHLKENGLLQPTITAKPGLAESFSAHPRTVLIFTEYEESKLLGKLKVLLFSQRISVDIINWNRVEDAFLALPRLVDSQGLARYGGFIFDNDNIYRELDGFNKGILHDYCKKNDYGILVLSGQSDHEKETHFIQFGDMPLWIKYGVKKLYNTEINTQSSMPQMTKAGKTLECGLHRNNHAIFWSNHSSFEEVAYSFKDLDANIDNNFNLEDFWKGEYRSEEYRANRSKFVTIMYDKGDYDGIRRVFFGPKVETLWQYKLLFLDALSVLSRGSLGRPLKRWILVDIDDIFVAHRGFRMKRDDVQVHMR